MDAWFKMGYFNDVLKVRRAQDHIFKTLGELKMCNGVLTPFDYKEPFPVFSGGTAPFGVAANLFGFVYFHTYVLFCVLCQRSLETEIFLCFSGGVWNDPLSSMYNPSAILGGSISSAFDAKVRIHGYLTVEFSALKRKLVGWSWRNNFISARFLLYNARLKNKRRLLLRRRNSSD